MRRREFLKGAGGLVVAFSLAPGSQQAQAATMKIVARDQVDGFLAIDADGAITLYSGKVDLGTGARAALRQMAAEELGIGIDRIAMIEGDTELTPDQGPTAGSTGIAVGGVEIRQAAATARQKLLALASEKLGLPVSALEARDGAVRATSGTAAIGFGELIGGHNFALAVDKAAPLVDPERYRVVGQPLPRPDLPAKFTGRHTYVHDVRVDGMLHGRAIRPPSPGATLLAVDAGSIGEIAGAQIVQIRDFLGVVAPSEWAAIRAARQLKAQWQETPSLPGSDGLADWVRRAAVAKDAVYAERGDATARLAASGKVIKASYYWPPQSHASMGPSCAVADVRSDRATIWTASQATHKFREVFARLLGLPREAVRLIYLDGSGCYGMNGHEDAAADAALLSRHVGRPVRVQWMREDEHGWDPKGPPQLLDLRAALDGDGRIAAWETLAFAPENTPGLPTVPLLGPAAAGLDQPHGMAPARVDMNTDPPYAIPDMRARLRWLKETPLRVSNLRAPGKLANVFAVESFTDELAAAAGVDPVEFRRRQIDKPRGIEVLQRVAARMNWQKRPSPLPVDAAAAILRGRGIAYVHYKSAENFLALGVEIELERASGAIRVTRCVCAHDCGLMINPDGVRAQVEGSILQGISRTLLEEVTFDRQRVTSTDWASYKVLRFADVPPLEIELVDRRRERPMGAGEAAITPVGPAIGNAVFDATGVRLRSVPFAPARVKAALDRHAA
jgi:nicotinate dehydrogenase subunit B